MQRERESKTKARKYKEKAWQKIRVACVANLGVREQKEEKKRSSRRFGKQEFNEDRSRGKNAEKSKWKGIRNREASSVT